MINAWVEMIRVLIGFFMFKAVYIPFHILVQALEITLKSERIINQPIRAG